MAGRRHREDAGDILVGERVRDLRARLRHGGHRGRAFEIARLDGEAPQNRPEHDVHLAPRLGLRPTLDALRIELPNHFRIDLVEAKVPDPRQEEAVEQPLVSVDRGRLESGRCEGSQVLGCDLLENGPRLRLRRALLLRAFAPAPGGPRRDEKGEPPPLLRPRRREHLHFRVATEPTLRSVRLCIDDVKDQPPLAAALHDAHCHGRTAFPRRVPPRPWVYHGAGRRLRRSRSHRRPGPRGVEPYPPVASELSRADAVDARLHRAVGGAPCAAPDETPERDRWNPEDPRRRFNAPP
jgi:hypothetical protein